MRIRVVVGGLTVWLLAACTTSSGAGATSDGSTGSSTTSSGESDGSSSAGTPDVPVSCEPWLDEPVDPPLLVRIVNMRSDTIYVIANEQEAFLLQDPDLNTPTWVPDGRIPICQDIMDGYDLCEGCPCSEFAVKLDPGTVYARAWPGMVYEPAPDLPAACGEVPQNCQGPCIVRRAARPGPWTFTAEAATGIMCETDPCEDCDVGLGGGCKIYGNLEITPVGLLPQVTRTVSYPETTNLDLVFE